jgi:hypothetical protein
VNVAGLFVYPVKSCRGLAVAQSELTRRGLALDRRWMVTRDDGQFVTQRELPQLALIDVRVEGAWLVLSAAGHGSTQIPVAYEARAARSDVRVWGQDVRASAHAEASGWISQVLAGRYRLVYMPADVERPVDPRRGRPGDVVSFADAYPLLLTTEASLRELNGRLPEPIGMERFRPNVVVSGSEPYAEDDWKKLCIGQIAFRAPKPCDRCVVTTIDPSTGHKGVEPLRTLSRYRKWEGKVWFGLNLIPERAGTLRIGDPVSIA